MKNTAERLTVYQRIEDLSKFIFVVGAMALGEVTKKMTFSEEKRAFCYLNSLNMSVVSVQREVRTVARIERERERGRERDTERDI